MFVGHGKGTNSQANRTPVGTVVDTFIRDMPNGGSQVVAIGLLDGDMDDLNVCSIEADVDITEDGDVTGVANVSAVALGNSSIDSPAFPGAQRLASMQFFDEDNNKKGLDNPAGGRRMTFAEIKTGVEELGLAPHRLFTADQVRDDNRLMTALSGEFTEQIATLEKDNAKLAKENEGLSKQAAEGEEAKTKIALSEGKQKLEAVIPEGMTDAQKKFLITEFKPGTVEELSEESLNSYVDQGTKRFAEMAQLFGGESSPSGGGGKDDESGKDKEPEDALLKAIIG